MKNLSFYLRNGCVQCRVGGRRITTKIKLPASHTLENGTIVGQDSDRLNKKLDAVRIAMSQHLRVKQRDCSVIVDPNRKDPTMYEYSKIVLDGIIDDKILSKSGRPYSEGSKIQWRQFSNLLYRFPTDVKVLRLDMSGDFNKKKRASELAKSYFQGLREFMSSLGYRMTTQATMFEKLKSLLVMAENEYMVRIDKTFRHFREEVPVVAITPDMVKTLLNSPVPDDKALRYAYEISCVVLVTSLRISDALSLTIEDLSNGHILSTNKKTGAVTKSPVPEKVYNMLMNNHMDTGSLYSMNVSRSDTDKLMAEMMPILFKDIATTVVTINRMTPDGKGYEKISKPLYEMVRPHMLRKSAITSMIVSGVPERFVKHLSGHKGNSKAFERYVAYVEKEYNDSIKEYQNKLING
jgi:integrase